VQLARAAIRSAVSSANPLIRIVMITIVVVIVIVIVAGRCRGLCRERPWVAWLARWQHQPRQRQQPAQWKQLMSEPQPLARRITDATVTVTAITITSNICW